MSLVQSLHKEQVARGEQSVAQCFTHRPCTSQDGIKCLQTEHFDLCLRAESGVSAMVVGEMGAAMTRKPRWFAQQFIYSREHRMRCKYTWINFKWHQKNKCLDRSKVTKSDRKFRKMRVIYNCFTLLWY